MKKLSDCFAELGFKKEASDEVKKAFVKNLMREAQKGEFRRKRTTPKSNKPKTPAEKLEQLQLPLESKTGTTDS